MEVRRIPEYSNKRDKGALMMLERDRVPNLLEFEDDKEEIDEDDDEESKEEEDEEEGPGPPPTPEEGALNMSGLGSMRSFNSLTLILNHPPKTKCEKEKKLRNGRIFGILGEGRGGKRG